MAPIDSTPRRFSASMPEVGEGVGDTQRGLDRDTLAAMADVEVLDNPRSESTATPWSLLATWPRDRSIALLNRGEGADPLPRWTLVTEPERVSALPATGVPPSLGDAEFATDWLADRLPSGPLGAASGPGPDAPPWATGRIAMFAYELGVRLEPAAASISRASPAAGSAGSPQEEDAGNALDHPDAPHAPDAPDSGDAWDAWMAEANWSLVFDHRAERWHRAGPVPAWAEAALSGVGSPSRFRLEPLRPTESDEAFERIVERCVELVHAGDLFQANLSRGFESELEGHPRDLAAAALAAGARFGAYVETSPGEAVISLSPELLVEVENDGRVRTCPIKGTRPAGSDIREFAADAKDAAELAMIVDLMRNDLGRICRSGSIRVVEPRRFERHPTIVHGVAEIEGRLRLDVDASSLLAATFPAGSITGAPKIRAMQVVGSLENARRGIYCGSIGWFDAAHGALLNVAIRTATLRRTEGGRRWRVGYRAGCGIVADSDASAECRESRDKTAVLGRHAAAVTPPDAAPDPDDADAPRSPRSPAGRPAERARRRR